MNLLDLVEPTTLCVSLMLLALGLLWTYVSLSTSRPEQPNLAALYEPLPPKGATGKKTNKQKSRKPEASPRAAPKPHPLQSEAGPAKKPNQKGVAKGQVGVVKSKVTKVKEPITQEDIRPEEGDEGEWQTQRSRQQLRALRSKQRQVGTGSDKLKDGSSGEETKLSPEDPAPEDPADGKKSNGKRKGKSKKVANSEAMSTPENSTDGNQEVGGAITPTPDRIPTPSEEKGLSPVEKALQEAAESVSPSPEEDVVADGGEFSTVKPKKQKKSRRKAPAKGSEDDWVHVDFPAST